MSRKVNSTIAENIETAIEKSQTPKRVRRDTLTSGRPLYLYDFNGNLVGRFRGPNEAAKKLLGYNNSNADIHDTRKLSILKTELALYAKSNSSPQTGITFVQGYVPSYEELSVEDITNNERISPVRGNKVLQYDFSGNLINVFENASDAAEKLGKSTAWISVLCNANFILRYDR